MSKLKLYLIIALLVALLAGSAYLFKSKVQEIKRLKNNIESVTSEIEYYRTEEGQLVAKTRVLELRANEFEHLYKEQAEKVKDLNLKLKRINTFIETQMGLRDTIRMITRDTVIVYKSEPIIAKTFTFNDQWTRIRGVIHKDTVDLDYGMKIKLDQVIYRVPKKFLFIKWGTKYYEQHITTDNKKVTIEYSTVIKDIKRK